MQSRCGHEQTIPSSVAGMQRFVCESCGHVSIKLVSVAITRPGIPKPRHQIDVDSLLQSGASETAPMIVSYRRGMSGGSL